MGDCFNMRVITAIWLLVAGFVFMAGCTTNLSTGLHRDLTEGVFLTPPQRVAIVAPTVTIYELSAGGVMEEVPQWSEKGTRLVTDLIMEWMHDYPELDLIPLPELTADEQALLDQHRALFDRIATNRVYIQNISAWKDKVLHPDDALGSGLSDMKTRIGVDALFFISGYDYVSSGGRKFTAFLAALGGMVLPMGYSVLQVGLIDLETGDVLWSNIAKSDTQSLKSEGDARQMVYQVLAPLPDFDEIVKANETN